MSKKRNEADSDGSLGAVSAGMFKGANLARLASPHPSVRHILEVVERLRARPYATNAVIGGEPGTGKEGLAHTLHELMHPEGAPLISISTAGRDEHELASELFGCAPKQRGERPTDGAVAAADGGTLVLDEIIGLSHALQRRLLEVLKRGLFHREGDDRERQTQLNVFVITDGNLPAEVREWRFRHDLYHKLARLDLVLPPVRERPEDIPAAATWMAHRVLADRGRPANVVLEASPGEPAPGNGTIVLRHAAIETLRHHRWPGNFRELEIVVERALLLYSDGTQITASDVTRALSDPRG